MKAGEIDGHVLVEKPEGKRPLERPRRRMDLREIV
jgi:hypothetical protein